MAPEQIRSPSQVGAEADIYALGVILYEMLTGRRPFEGATSWDVLDRVMDQEAVPVCRLQPGIARDLETICLKCLRKEPGRRYASATSIRSGSRQAPAPQAALA
jgi:serine/threonine protein kinase